MLLDTSTFSWDNEEDCLREWAKELVLDISALDPARSKELVSSFLFEIASAAAEQRQKEERRARQASGLAAAKARGVQLGRRRMSLPEGFDESYRAWRDGELSIKQAAESCGMNRTSFRRAIERREQEWAAQ